MPVLKPMTEKRNQAAWTDNHDFLLEQGAVDGLLLLSHMQKQAAEQIKVLQLEGEWLLGEQDTSTTKVPVHTIHYFRRRQYISLRY